MALRLPKYLANLMCPCGHTIGEHKPTLESGVVNGEYDGTYPDRESRTIPAGAA